MNEHVDQAVDSTPDLDAIAQSFDEIERALRRLDDGSYFSSSGDAAVISGTGAPDREGSTG